MPNTFFLSVCLPAVIVGAGVLVLVLLSGIRFIPNSRIGIVEKRFGAKGSIILM